MIFSMVANEVENTSEEGFEGELEFIGNTSHHTRANDAAQDRCRDITNLQGEHPRGITLCLTFDVV